MTKILKLLKIEFKSNFMIFFVLNMVSAFSLIISCVVSNIIYLREIKTNYTSKSIYVYDYVPYGFISLVLLLTYILVVVYTAVSLIRKISKNDGTVYSMMQLPVKSYRHIQVTYISSLLFTISNGILTIIILNVYSRYLRIEMIDIVRNIPGFQDRILSVNEIINKILLDNPFIVNDIRLIPIVSIKWIVLISIVIVFILLTKMIKNTPIYITAFIILLSFYSLNIVEFMMNIEVYNYGYAYTSYFPKLIISALCLIATNRILINKIEY